jgi:hypothetical protein
MRSRAGYGMVRMKMQQEKLTGNVKDMTRKILKTGNDAARADVDAASIALIRSFFRILLNHFYVLTLQTHEWNALNPSDK